MPAKLPSHLMLSRHGIYYLRIERDGIEHRRSLRTRDPIQARAAAWRFGATIHGMSSQKSDDPLFIFTEAGAEKLESMILKIEINRLERDQKNQDMYARIEEQTRHLQPQSQPQQQQPPSLPAVITINDACKQYMSSRAGQITEGTVRTWQSCFNKLTAAFGPRLAHTIPAIEVSAELARLGVTVSPSTIKKDAQTWAILWTWLIEQGYATANPVKMPKWGRAQLVRLNQERGRERQQYNADDIKILFATERLDSLVRPEEAWLPVIALFTGARLEALCRLKPSDISAEKIHFDAAHDKTGKERVIPLHPYLKSAGLVEYAKEIASHFGADGYLFPHLNDVGGRRGHYFSKIFGDQRKALGIETGKDFHSFRVTLISHMQANGCPADLRRLYVGHETGEQLDVHERNYSKASFTPEILADMIFPYIKFEWSDWKYSPNSAVAEIKKIMVKQKRGSLQRQRKVEKMAI
jgi:integrase